MECEKEDNYTWAYSTLRTLMDEKCLPMVIITDKKIALMNVIEIVFPRITHFICRWHINRSIMTTCKKHIRYKDKCDSFMASWNLLVWAHTEELYRKRLQLLCGEFADYQKAVEHVVKNWVDPYGHRFMSYNTNNVKHYGNTTISRAESQHRVLKRQLQSIGNFKTCWENFHTLMETSHTTMKESFEKSINFVHHEYRVSTYMSLRGFMSTNALTPIHNEISNLDDGVMDVSRCGCILHRTCGLPCTHELSEYVSKGLPIPLDVVDDFWRKLDMKPQTVGAIKQINLGNRLQNFMKGLYDKWERLKYSQQELILRRIEDAVNPNTTSLIEPSTFTYTPTSSKKKTSTKRDPSAFEFPLHQIESSCETEHVVYNIVPAVPVAIAAERCNMHLSGAYKGARPLWSSAFKPARPLRSSGLKR